MASTVKLKSDEEWIMEWACVPAMSRTDSVSGAPSPSPSWKSSQDQMAPTEFIPSGTAGRDWGIRGFYTVLQETWWRLYFWMIVWSALSYGSPCNSCLRLWDWKSLHFTMLPEQDASRGNNKICFQTSSVLTLILPIIWWEKVSV